MKHRLIFVVLIFVMCVARIAYADPEDVSAAIRTANEQFEGVAYSWTANAHCSTFVSAYLKALGFDVQADNQGLTEYEAVAGSPIPESSTYKQVKRLLALDTELGGGFAYVFSATEVLTLDFWKDYQIPVGSLVYFTKAISDNGYDEPAHVAIYKGSSPEPVFAEFALGMNEGPMLDRSLKEVADGIYWDTAVDGWNLHKADGVGILNIYIFDVEGMKSGSGHGEVEFASQLQNQTKVVGAQKIVESESSETWATGGPVVPNSTRTIPLYDVFLTVNLYDGTAALYEKVGTEIVQIPFDPTTGKMELYTVLGRGLKVNKALTEDYAGTEWAADGSRYDGEAGIFYYANGVPRTTYTPPFQGEYFGIADVENFGLIGGHTSIALIKAILDQGTGPLVLDGVNSHYTIHAVPQETPDQEILLREPDLVVANGSSESAGPLLWPTLNRSSGCVNFDRGSWFEVLVPRLNGFSEAGKKIVVIFSYPNVDQDQIIRGSHYMVDDPLSNRSIREWSYGDTYDTRTFAPGA